MDHKKYYPEKWTFNKNDSTAIERDNPYNISNQ